RGARVQTVSASAAARVGTSVRFFMATTSVLIGGRVASAPVDDRSGQRLTLQRVGVDGVGRIAGGADRDAHLRGEFVVLDTGDQAGDHALGVLVVGVEQDERNRAPIGVTDQVGVAHFADDQLRDFLQRAIV